jgi:hypothetical protein
VEIVVMLDAAIAAASDPAVRRHLESARRALAGTQNGNGVDGALSTIERDLDAAAIAFLRQAIRDLGPQAAGADVAVMIALLQQVVTALSAAQPRE